MLHQANRSGVSLAPLTSGGSLPTAPFLPLPTRGLVLRGPLRLSFGKPTDVHQKGTRHPGKLGLRLWGFLGVPGCAAGGAVFPDKGYEQEIDGYGSHQVEAGACLVDGQSTGCGLPGVNFDDDGLRVASLPDSLGELPV